MSPTGRPQGDSRNAQHVAAAASTLAPEELDELYTRLCYRMARAGEPATPQILARLVLLLMHEVGDAGRIGQAIAEATRDFPEIVAVESPL